MEENLIKVYVQVDSNNVIKQIDSSIFINDLSKDWFQIDEGSGDKYSHAQSMYLPSGGTIDDLGRGRYKFVEGKVIELTEEEKERLFPSPKQELSLENRVAMLENLQLQQEGVI